MNQVLHVSPPVRHKLFQDHMLLLKLGFDFLQRALTMDGSFIAWFIGPDSENI